MSRVDLPGVIIQSRRNRLRLFAFGLAFGLDFGLGLCYSGYRMKRYRQTLMMEVETEFPVQNREQFLSWVRDMTEPWTSDVRAVRLDEEIHIVDVTPEVIQ